MKVPDLGHMIQIEEYHAQNICINCGEKMAMHSLVWLPYNHQYTEGRAIWQCHPEKNNRIFQTTFESITDASS